VLTSETPEKIACPRGSTRHQLAFEEPIWLSSRTESPSFATTIWYTGREPGSGNVPETWSPRWIACTGSVTPKTRNWKDEAVPAVERSRI
jgi:hypothetical protein